MKKEKVDLDFETLKKMLPNVDKENIMIFLTYYKAKTIFEASKKILDNEELKKTFYGILEIVIKKEPELIKFFASQSKERIDFMSENWKYVEENWDILKEIVKKKEEDNNK